MVERETRKPRPVKLTKDEYKSICKIAKPESFSGYVRRQLLIIVKEEKSQT